MAQIYLMAMAPHRSDQSNILGLNNTQTQHK